MSYKVRITKGALRQIRALPNRIQPAVLEFIEGPLAENPHRLGHPLRVPPFVGRHSAARGPYRILYVINDEAFTVDIVRVAARSHAYRTPAP